MKRLIFIILLIGFSIGFLSANSDPFIPGYFHEKIIIACFEKEAVGNREGILNFELENDIVKTGLQSFDRLSEQYRFVDLNRLIDFVKNLDWNDEGVYIQNIYRIYLDSNSNIEEALSNLQNDPNIVNAEYETINRLRYIPNDPSYPVQWHLPKIECPETWDYTFGDEEIVIGIVDSGIKWNHPDLMNNIWINQPELDGGMTINWTNGTVSGSNGIDEDGNGRADDVIGYNFYGGNNNDSYQDWAYNDHGTHVAGCAGAVGDNGLGVAGSSMIVKMISSRHAPNNFNSDHVTNGYNGIIYCADSGADIINCSWGGPGTGGYPNSVINYATDQGALVICAAGNDDTEHTDYYQDYPSDCDNAISVAATDQNDFKTYFSDYGEPIDVSAPGINIKSTIIADNGYASYQGTSMASPIVCGIAALVKSIHSDIAPLDLRSRIMNTTDYIDTINPDYAGLLGTGRVNAFQATMYDLIPKLTIEAHNLVEFDGDGDGVPNPGEVLQFTVMIQNGYFAAGFWANATGVTATLSCENPEVEILQGTSNLPDIAGGISIWNNDQPFQFQTSEDMNELDISLIITLTANQSTEYPYSVDRELIASLSLIQEGWPFEVGGASTSSALIIDINNDEEMEIVFGDHTGTLHAVNVNGTEELSGFPIDLGGNISAAVAVGNIDADDYLEIIVGNESSQLIGVDHTGAEIFNYATGGLIKGSPMIADVDGNGSKEIIACTFTGNKAIVLNADGTEYGNFPVTLAAGVLGSPAIADLNGDGHLDIVCDAMNGTLNAISTSDGNMLDNFPYTLGGGSWNGPIIANIDADDDPEILIGTLGQKLIAINHDGTLNFEKEVEGQIKTSVVTADLDNDDSVEIIFGNSNGWLYVVDNMGNDIDNFPINFGVAIESTPILADMDDNGSIDIIFGDNDGYLHSVDITGNETANFPLFLENTLKVSPAIGYADADDDPEIIVPNQSSFMLVDYKRQIGDIKWQCFKANPERTGIAPDLTSISNNEIHDFQTVLGRNYPNPFIIGIGSNSVTTIDFNLKEDTFVNLDIYNIRGQLVNTIASDNFTKGPHFISWNGKDNQNKPAASGIYFYKLSTQDYVCTKKMILIK